MIQLILFAGGPSLLDFTYVHCISLTIITHVESEYTNFLLIFLLIIPLILSLVWGEKTMGHFLCPSLAQRELVLSPNRLHMHILPLIPA